MNALLQSLNQSASPEVGMKDFWVCAERQRAVFAPVTPLANGTTVVLFTLHLALAQNLSRAIKTANGGLYFAVGPTCNL